VTHHMMSDLSKRSRKQLERGLKRMAAQKVLGKFARNGCPPDRQQWDLECKKNHDIFKCVSCWLRWAVSDVEGGDNVSQDGGKDES